MIFTAESSGLKVTMGQAVKMKNQRSRHKLPDLLILEPRAGFSGLILELKEKSFNLNLALASEAIRHNHVKEQKRTIDLLSGRGYYADFGVGFDQCREIIDRYMGWQRVARLFEPF